MSVSETTLVSGSLDMTVRIWDLRTGQQTRYTVILALKDVQSNEIVHL